VLDLPSSRILQDITETSMKPNEHNSKKLLGCTSLAWDKNGTHLFAGFTDNYIRVYKLEEIVGAKEEAAE
jgi:hypothetical protein